MVAAPRSLVSSAARLVTASVAALGAGLLVRTGSTVTTAFGASWRRKPSDLPTSDHFDGESFHNLLPSGIIAPTAMPGMVAAMLTRGDIGKPPKPVPLVASDLSGPVADLAVTWLGHASALLEIDGLRVLADPVWSERVSPSQQIGPKRMHAVPIAFDDLPPIDAVIISHDHYDHLDLDTVRMLRDRSSAPFIVPLGVGGHLRSWGVPADRVIELDWDGEHRVGELTFTCIQARHFSGRSVRRDDTLWSSWAVVGPQHRVFFGGDTGYTPTFADVGAELGPFDLTLMPIGAYDPRWADIHLNPEEAVRTHLDVRGGVLMPIHWATFDLAFHAWVEPVSRLLTAAAEHDVPVLIPRPGQRVTAVADPSDDRWWEFA
jgi:L-ascorbate metabolism protein UlaG (beta-lactamase superfamily)